MKYLVTVEEIVSDEFEIEATTKEEALNKARTLYEKGEIVLEPGNIINVDFLLEAD